MMKLNDIKCLLPCLAALIAGSVVLAPSSTSAVALPQAGNSSAPILSPLVLTDSWPIKRVVAIRSGALVFAGGNVRGGADGLVFIAPNKFIRLAAIGDPVPGNDGAYLVTVGVKEPVPPYGNQGDFSFNARGDLAFLANIVNCGSASQVAQCAASSPQREGIFLFSETNRITIALRGDPLPGPEGGTFLAFDRIWMNKKGTVLFSARVIKADGIFSDGLFSFSQNRLEKIAISGDITPLGRINLQTAITPSISDQDDVTFSCYPSGQGLALVRYAAGVFTRLSAAGDPAPGGGQFGSSVEGAVNNLGDIVFHPARGADGLYLLGRDGGLTRIIKDGDGTPIGGYFALTGFGSKDAYRLVNPEINDSTDILFASPLGGGPSRSGIFLASRGAIEKVAAYGDPVPGSSATIASPFGFDLNNLGMAAFSAVVGPPGGLALFSYNKGNVFGIFFPGDAAPDTDGSFKDLKEFFIGDSGEVIFHATVCCGQYKEGIFRASYPQVDIPNGSFETPGDDGRPASWQTAWNNSGSGEASRFNCGGDCAFDGTSVLRLHVNPGGGSTFVVSDPIAVFPGAAYVITGQMRYYLNSDSDTVFFSVLQLDNAGNAVGLDEVTGSRGDNSWDWVPKGLLIRAKPGAQSVRIRIGLLSGTESYLDVDAIR